MAILVVMGRGWNGRALFERRKDEGLSQAEAAALFRCSPTAWRNWEHGSPPSANYRSALEEWIAGRGISDDDAVTTNELLRAILDELKGIRAALEKRTE